MSKLSFDYSKWDRIDDSEDEETHYEGFDKALNVRVNRMDRQRKDDAIDAKQQALREVGDFHNAQALEERRPIHVDNACHVKEERTIINGFRDKESVFREQAFSTNVYLQFKADHAKVLAEFADADWEQSHGMLTEHGHVLLTGLARDHFNLAALDEEMKGNTPSMKKLCHQSEIISKMFEIAEPVHRHPRDMVDDFFERFAEENGESVRVAFQEGVDNFAVNIQKRAEEKKREQENKQRETIAAEGNSSQLQKEPLVKAMYSMSREERLGPGGLDPVEVLESLPQDLQEAFRCGDIEMLKRVAEEMPEEDFNEHLQRCVDSGLWKE